MNTTGFVALQMAKEPNNRVIPDIVYMRNVRGQTITILRELRNPWTATRVFNPNYLYEDVDCFADIRGHYYPNDVIPWSLVLSQR